MLQTIQAAGALKTAGAIMGAVGIVKSMEYGYKYANTNFRHKQHSSFTYSADIMNIPQAVTFQMSKLSNAPGLQAITYGGAAMGAATGGALLGRLGQTMGKGGRYGAAGLAVGAVLGGVKAFNAYNSLATAASTTLQTTLGLTNQKANYNRVRVGSGTRSWTKPTMGRRMRPDAHGAGGDLVLSMHRIRHKSLI